MNDGVGYQGGLDTDLMELADEIRTLAADQTIEETMDTELVDTHDEAYEKAAEVAAGADGEERITVHDDGRITGECQMQDAKGRETTYIQTFVPKDSQAWSDVYNDLAWVPEQFEFFAALPEGKNSGQDFDDIVGEFDAKGLLSDGAEGLEDGETSSTSLSEAEDWSGMTTAARQLHDWKGAAVQDFLVLYCDRFDVVRVGQLAGIKICRETLEIANTTYTTARENAHEVAENTLNALEATTGGGTDLQTKLQVLAAVASVGAGAAGVAAAPATFGTSGLAGWAGIAAGTASLASVAASADDGDEAADSKKEQDIGGETVSDVLHSMQQALATLKGDVTGVERRTSDALTDFQSSLEGNGVSVALSTGERQLTVRESYFEPPRPALAEVGSSYSDLHGDSVSKSDAEDSLEDLLDMDNVGRTGAADRETIDVDIGQLLTIGKTTLPGIAGQYSDFAAQVQSAGEGNSSHFSDGARGMADNDLPDDTYVHAGAVDQGGSLYEQWTAVHELVVDYLTNSAENLELAAWALQLTAESLQEGSDEFVEGLWSAYAEL